MTSENFFDKMIILSKRKRKIKMSRIHELNNAIDNVGEVGMKIGYADTLIRDLIEEYDGRDLEKMRTKASWELPKIMTFLNIIFDYVSDSKLKINEIEKELSRICDEVKKEQKFSPITNRDKVA